MQFLEHLRDGRDQVGVTAQIRVFLGCRPQLVGVGDALAAVIVAPAQPEVPMDVPLRGQPVVDPLVVEDVEVDVESLFLQAGQPTPAGRPDR